MQECKGPKASRLELDAKRYLVALVVDVMLNRQFSRFRNRDCLDGSIRSASLELLDAEHDIHPFNDCSKDHLRISAMRSEWMGEVD